MTEQGPVSIERFAGVWEFRFHPIDVTAVVRKARANREGDVVVEVELRYGPSDSTSTLAAPVRVNLNSSRTKTEWANSANKRLALDPSGDITWGDVVEKMADICITEFRRGDPIIRIADIQVPGPTQYLVEPVLPLNEPTLIYGDGGAGKSLIAAALSVCVSTGHPFLEYAAPTVTGSVLYLDWEATEGGLKRRLDRVAAGIEREVPRDIYYRRCKAPLVDEIEELSSEAAALDTKLVVVDSLGYALGGDPNEAKLAIETMSALRHFACTVVVIAHPPKGEMKSEDERTVTGSSFFRYGARAMWEMRQGEGASEEEVRLSLYNRKMNEDRPIKLPIVFTATFNNGPGRPVFLIPAGQMVLGDLEGLGLADRIRFILGKATEPVEVRSIIAYLARHAGKPESEQAIRATLARMSDVANVAPKGSKDGQWALRNRKGGAAGG